MTKIADLTKASVPILVEAMERHGHLQLAHNKCEADEPIGRIMQRARGRGSVLASLLPKCSMTARFSCFIASARRARQ